MSAIDHALDGLREVAELRHGPQDAAPPRGAADGKYAESFRWGEQPDTRRVAEPADKPRRQNVRPGISTWEAVLNEILDLRATGMLDSAGLAYGALQGVEQQVLPDWKEHGKAILAERGLGEEALRMMGMKIPAMERLYQLVYAFSFGFAEMMRGTVSERRAEDQGKLLLAVLDVHSTLLSEALNMTHRDLLGEMFAAKERELTELRRDRNNLARRVQSADEEIAWAHEQEHQAQDALAAAVKQAAQDVSEANKRARDAEHGQFAAEEARDRAEAEREAALAAAATLRARVSELEQEAARQAAGWNQEAAGRAVDRTEAAAAAAEAQRLIQELRGKVEESTRKNNLLHAQVTSPPTPSPPLRTRIRTARAHVHARAHMAHRQHVRSHPQ